MGWSNPPISPTRPSGRMASAFAHPVNLGNRRATTRALPNVQAAARPGTKVGTKVCRTDTAAGSDLIGTRKEAVRAPVDPRKPTGPVDAAPRPTCTDSAVHRIHGSYEEGLPINLEGEWTPQDLNREHLGRSTPARLGANWDAPVRIPVPAPRSCTPVLLRAVPVRRYRGTQWAGWIVRG